MEKKESVVIINIKEEDKMIIDFHTHTFPDFLAPKVIPKLEKSACIKAFVDGTVEGLKASMLEAGIDISVVLPAATSPAQVETCNNSAQKINEEQPNKIHSFCAMHPDYADYKIELKRIKDMGLKGIKLHPDYQKTLFDDIRYKRILECATELDLITVVHAGLDIGLPDPIHATPQRIKNLIDDVHPEKLVLAHMGGFQLWNEVLELLGDKDVYLDASFSLGTINYSIDATDEFKMKHKMMDEALFMRMLEAFGEDRILFGTDSPWGGQKETLECFKALPLTEGQSEKILSLNASKLLQIR